MKIIIKTVPVLFASSLLCSVALAETFEIKNDWHYASLSKPTQSISVSEIYEDDHSEIQKTAVNFNDQGYITEIIYDDTLKQVFEPYQDKVRNIAFIYEAANETHTSPLKSTWLAEDHQRFDDDDLVIDTFYNSKGQTIRHELFMDNMETPDEVTEYYYLEKDELKPTTDKKFVYITTLESDEFGNWIEQKEEHAGNKSIIRQRKIQYYP